MLKKQVIDATKYTRDYLNANDILKSDSNSIIPQENLIHAIESTISNEKIFTLFLVAPLSNPDLVSENHYSIIQKIIKPVISKKILVEKQIYDFDTYIAILIPEINNEATIELTNKLTRILSKYKMKTSQDTSIMLSPKIGYCDSNEITNPQNLIDKTLKEIGIVQNNIAV